MRFSGRGASSFVMKVLKPIMGMVLGSSCCDTVRRQSIRTKSTLSFIGVGTTGARHPTDGHRGAAAVAGNQTSPSRHASYSALCVPIACIDQVGTAPNRKSRRVLCHYTRHESRELRPGAHQSLMGQGWACHRQRKRAPPRIHRQASTPDDNVCSAGLHGSSASRFGVALRY